MRDRILLYALAVSVGIHLVVFCFIGRTALAHPKPAEESKAVEVTVVRTIDDVEQTKPEPIEIQPKSETREVIPTPAPAQPEPKQTFFQHLFSPKPQPQPLQRVYKVAGNPGGALNMGAASSHGQNLGTTGRTPVGWVPGAEHGLGAGSGSGAGVGRPEPVKGAEDGPGREAAPPPPPPADVHVRVCADSGMLPGPNCVSTVTRSYRPGKEPSETCNTCRPPHKSVLADRSVPEMISGHKSPRYPSEARDEGIQGSVTLEYTINTDGRVEGVKVASSSGHGDLDEAAVDAVKSRKYKPATQAGIPRDYKKRETFHFTLD